MSWSILQNVPNPHMDLNGDPYSGAVLKAYLPGTTTSTSIAIDSSGSSPQASITFNAEGKLEVSGNDIQPYIDRKVKWGIFANATDAAANTPFQMGPFDNVDETATNARLTGLVVDFTTLAAAVAETDVLRMFDGAALNIKERTTGNGGGGVADVVLSSTVTEDTYRIIQCTGIGTLSIVIRVGDRLDVKRIGADRSQATDSLDALEFAAAYAISSRTVLTASKEDFFKISDQLDLSGVAANFNYATIKADFDGKAAVIFGNDADIQNLDLSPTTAFENDAAGLGASAPVDFLSHGFEVTGRPILLNIAARDFKGHGWNFETANSNAAELWNLLSSGNHRGFNFADNITDNLSIMEGSLYAFGNSNAGFYSGTGSNFRQNNLFIRSEFNNKNLAVTFGGFVIDVFIGGANRNQLNIYSEGTGGVIDFNIYVDEGSSDFYNTINSFRQDLDHITHSNVTRSGSRHYQNDADGSAAIGEIIIGNSNVNTLPMFVDYRRGSGRYGKILGKDAALWISHSNDEQLLGCADGYAIVGNTHVIAAKVILTTGTPTLQIKIGDLSADKLMCGVINIRAISGSDIGRRQFTQSFNSFNGTVTNGTVSNNNINSDSDAFGTFTVTQVSTEVFLNLTYSSGDLGTTYEIKYQVDWSIT